MWNEHGSTLIHVCVLMLQYFFNTYTYTIQLEILAGIKFGSWSLNRHCKYIGGSVRDRHMYIYKYEILADFNLAVAS